MKKMAISEAEKNANVSKILMEQKLLEKDSTRRQEEIENAMYLAREKSLADADFYRWDFPFLMSLLKLYLWIRYYNYGIGKNKLLILLFLHFKSN